MARVRAIAESPPVPCCFQAYREHSAALTDAGYQRTYTDPEKQYREDRLSCFWFDIVWDGFLDRRSENAIPAAQVR